MSKETAYRSFKTYEWTLDEMVKAGTMSTREARYHLSKAKKNYKNQNYNRQIDNIIKE